jgi:hypothetical protein
MHIIMDNQNASATYVDDGRVLNTDKATGAQRFSLNTWPDFKSAKAAFHAGDIKWGEWDNPNF